MELKARLYWPAAVLAASLFAPHNAWSQGLEEVVVTARKREESLQDIGVSVTALSSQTIQQQALSSVRELATQIPGLTFQESFGRRDDRPGLRGLTSVGTVDFGVESGTAIFLDGVYIQADTSAFGLHDLERVEVVRGPQSALYGRNSYAGAINFVTRTPSDEPRFFFNGRYGRYDEMDVRAGAEGRLTSTLAGGIYVRRYSFDSQFADVGSGNDGIGDEETTSISGSVLFEPADWVRVRARVAYSRDNDGHIPFTMVNANTDFEGDGITSNDADDYFVGTIPTPKDITGDEDLVGPLNESLLFESGMERDTLITTFRADIDLPRNWTLSLLGGYHKEDRQTGSDSASTGTFNSGLSLFAFTDRDLTDWSAELRLESDQSQRVRGLVGLFYFREDSEEDGYSYDGAAAFTPVFRPDSLADAALDRGVTLRETRNWAVFGSVAFDITDRLTGTIEGRYAQDLKRIVGSRRNGGGPTEINLFPAREKFSSFTARVIAEYELSDDLLLYALAARGTKPGGFNDNSNRDPQAILTLFSGEQQPLFDEETQRTVEIGFKSSWLDDRLQVNFSGYASRVDNAQLTQTYSWCVGAPSPFCFFLPFAEFRAGANIINVDEVEILGGELEVRAAVTDYLNVSFGYAYVDSEIQSGSNVDFGRLFPDFDGIGPEADLAGQEFPRISPHQFNWAANYSQPFSFGQVFLNLNGSYESSRWVQVSNLAKIPSATIVNLRGGVTFAEHYTIALWGKNIFDEDAPVDALRFRDGDFVRAFQIANRRGATYGIDVNIEF